MKTKSYLFVQYLEFAPFKCCINRGFLLVCLTMTSIGILLKPYMFTKACASLSLKHFAVIKLESIVWRRLNVSGQHGPNPSPLLWAIISFTSVYMLIVLKRGSTALSRSSCPLYLPRSTHNTKCFEVAFILVPANEDNVQGKPRDLRYFWNSHL